MDSLTGPHQHAATTELVSDLGGGVREGVVVVERQEEPMEVDDDEPVAAFETDEPVATFETDELVSMMMRLTIAVVVDGDSCGRGQRSRRRLVVLIRLGLEIRRLGLEITRKRRLGLKINGLRHRRLGLVKRRLSLRHCSV